MVEEINKISLDGDTDKTTGPVSESMMKTKLRKFKKPGLIAFGVVGFVFLFYLIVGVISLVLAKPMIGRIQTVKAVAQESFVLFKNQDLPAAETKVKEVKSGLNELSVDYQKLKYLAYVPLVSPYYQDGGLALSSAHEGIDAATVLLEAITPYADVLGFEGQGSFVGGNAEDRIAKIVQTLDKVTPKLDEVIAKIDKMDENISQINPQRYPKKIKGVMVREQIAKAKDLLAEARSTIDETKPVIEVLPAVLGYPDKKKYLILFQNDGELRPTGGFITAFSVFDVETGKARSARSDDIYSLDEKLGNRLEAPQPLKDYLNVQAYHLRDMNFSPDFKVSMDEFVNHYESIKGVDPIDGVVAIDTKILTGLIDVLGPVEVPGFGRFTNENDERCNIPQVVCELEYIVDEPLPDIVVNRKSTILGPMMQELMFKAYGSPKQQWPALFSMLINSMKEKHMLLYFKDSQLQSAAESFGAAGKIKDFDGDYLAVIDANLGGAKSNLYVTSAVEQKYELVEGKIVKEVAITYVHPEPMDDCNLERAGGLCLSGILQNYFRVYVPQGSELIEGLGSETEITTSEELGKTVFTGFFKLRGGGGRAKIVLQYRLPDRLTADNGLTLLLQKQPGPSLTKQKIVSSNNVLELDLVRDEQITIDW